MKKILCLVLTVILLFSTACVQKVVKEDDGTVVVEPKKYADMTLDEKLALKASSTHTAADPEESDALAPALDSETGLWGYINVYGEWVREPQYQYAFPFSEGYASVLTTYEDTYAIISSEGEDYDVCNQSNNYSIYGYQVSAASTFVEGYGVLHLETDCEQDIEYMLGNKIAIINAYQLPKTSGVKYESTKFFAVGTPFKNGVAVTMRRTNQSLLNAMTRSTIEKKNYYQSAYVINVQGNVEAELPAGYDIDDYALDSNGIIIVRDMTTEDGFYGLCNTEGEIVADCIYRRITYCEGDLYLVCDKNGFWGYINKEGETVIPCKYQGALPFSEGLAAVCEETYWGVIDEQGNTVIDFVWDAFAEMKYADAGTNAGMAAFSNGYAAAASGDYWAIIDTEGNILYSIKVLEDDVCPFNFITEEGIVFEEFEDGMATGLYGVLDFNGSITIQPNFAYIGLFSE